MKKALLFLIINLTLFSIISQESLPMGFRDLVIGLSLDETKTLLERDGYFDYRGDPDVSMLLTENRSIIETSGKLFIESGYFQFYNEELYTITLILDQQEIDFHTMFTNLTEKYGPHKSLSPSRVEWSNDMIKITLEKPLTVKYVGLKVFNQIIEEDTTEQAIQDQLREEFIDAF